ncbi:hypothetical protein Dimus_010901 [Dionaea muscipula]
MENTENGPCFFSSPDSRSSPLYPCFFSLRYFPILCFLFSISLSLAAEVASPPSSFTSLSRISIISNLLHFSSTPSSTFSSLPPQRQRAKRRARSADLWF